jgi:hypothetical protein
MTQHRNRYGLRVTWLDGRSSDHWFRTVAICDFALAGFNRMRHDGWDGPDSRAEVHTVTPIALPIIARSTVDGAP